MTGGHIRVASLSCYCETAMLIFVELFITDGVKCFGKTLLITDRHAVALTLALNMHALLHAIYVSFVNFCFTFLTLSGMQNFSVLTCC